MAGTEHASPFDRLRTRIGKGALPGVTRSEHPRPGMAQGDVARLGEVVGADMAQGRADLLVEILGDVIRSFLAERAEPEHEGAARQRRFGAERRS